MRFQIPRRTFVAIVSIPVVLSVSILLWRRGIAADVAVPTTVITMAGAAALSWLASLTQVIEISPDGIVLYRVNRLAWSDIISAAPARVLGLRYLKLSRSSGNSWWLPLFFRGATDVPSALVALAPENHPLKACFTSLLADMAARTTPNR